MAFWDDKVIWITGASSGIGEALAKGLSLHPVKLILSARRVEELERVKQSCAQPANIEILVLDLTDYGTHAQKAKEAIGLFRSSRCTDSTMGASANGRW